MIVKNNTNGKLITIESAKFDALSKVQKSNFTIVEAKDIEEVVQVVENLVEVKADSPVKKSKKNIEPETE